MAATDATVIPVKGQAYRVTFPILDADGDLVTGATSLDSEVSKNGATFADCTNEATEIATSSGMYYLDLTAAEMTADTVAIIVKTATSGAKTTPIVLYPSNTVVPEFGIVRRGTPQSITSTTTTIDASAAFGDNVLAGMVLGVYGSTQGYWQYRAVNSNVGSTDVLTHDAWTTTPSGTLSYIIYAGAPMSSTATLSNNVTQIASSSAAATSLKNMLTGVGGETITATTVGNRTGNVSGSVGSVTGAVGSVTGAVGSVTGAVGSVTGAVGSVTAAVTVGTNNDKTGYALSNAGVDALYTRALTESYAADGAAPTIAQVLFAIQQFLQEKAASGTALTVKRLDGSTTAMTFLLNDATNPTSITRTS